MNSVDTMYTISLSDIQKRYWYQIVAFKHLLLITASFVGYFFLRLTDSDSVITNSFLFFPPTI